MAVDRTPQQLDLLGQSAEETAKVQKATNKIQKKKNKEDIQQMGARSTAAKKLSDKLEDAGKSSKFMSGAVDIFTARLSDKGTQSILKFAGGLGLAAAVTKKYTDGIIAINRALPNFNESFGEALLTTGKAVFQTGLNLNDLSKVMKDNTLAFRTFRTSLTGAVKDNEALRLSLGLSREEFTTLTARAAIQSGVSADAADAQEQLAKFSRRYIINLNELALQTGRQASEVEASRVANSRSSAGFIATLDKQGATLFQQAQRDAERAGSGFATQLSALVSSADFTENIKKINEFTIAALNTNAQTQLVGQKELQATLFKLQKGAAQRNGALVAEAFRELTPFGIALNESQEALLKFPVPVNEAQALLVTNAANIGRVLTETGQTATESGAAQLKGQRIQLKKLEEFFGTTIGKLTSQFSLLSAALGNFGGDIGSIALSVIALNSAFGIAGKAGGLIRGIGTATAAAGGFGKLLLSTFLGPAGIFLALTAGVLLLVKKAFPEATDFLIRDVKKFLSGGDTLEEIRQEQQARAQIQRTEFKLRERLEASGKSQKEINEIIARNQAGGGASILGAIGTSIKENLFKIKPSPGSPIGGDPIGVKTIKKIQAQAVAKAPPAAPAPIAGPPVIELGVGEAESLARGSGASLSNMNQQLANLNNQVNTTIRLQDAMNANLRTIADNSRGNFGQAALVNATKGAPTR